MVLYLLLLGVGVGTLTLAHLRRERGSLIDATRTNAALLLSIVEKSVFNAMRTGSPREVQATLAAIGDEAPLLRVRIFQPDGTIRNSSRAAEIGRRLGANELKVFQQRLDQGLFQVDGPELLSVAKPLVADERCSSCHGGERGDLGVLSLDYSLADTRRRLGASARWAVFATSLGVLLLFGGGVALWSRGVRRPLRELAGQMAKVEQGDFSARVVPQGSDAMGSLEHGFNTMVDHLGKTCQECEQRLSQQMARADRLAAVGEMASGVAHEIKNPLAGIGGAIAVLASDFSEDDPRRAIIGEILEQLTRLNETATDLLFFGRPGEPDFSRVDLNALVGKTLSFITRHPEAKHIRRSTRLAPGLSLVWADEKQLQQVLFNVMLNGIQAMAGQGTLTVETAPVEREGRRYGRIEVRDTGGGIPAEQLEKIFMPFYTTKTQGTGLGLAICRRLMEQQGGTIRVDSRHGEGTIFIIELPVMAGEPRVTKEGCHAPT